MPKISQTAIAIATALLLSAAGTAVAQAKAPAKTPAKTPVKTQVKVTAKPITKALTAKNRTTTITIRNTTARRLTGMSLAVGARKGVKVTLPGARKKAPRVRALRPLAARKSMRVPVRLAKLGKKAPKSGAITVSIRQRGKVIGRARLAFGPAATKPRPGQPEPGVKTLTGRHFWGSQYTLNGIQQHTLYFTGPDFVFTGDIKGAWPTCAAAGETCRPYTFDPATDAVTIDGKPATIDGDKLTLDGQSYFALGQPTAGARWDIVLTYSNSFGVCPLFCSYYTEHVTFRPDGTFIISSVASGSGPVVDWASVPEDKKGTYEVGADRMMRLTFANGTQRVETLGLFPDDAGSYPANPSAGVILDSDGYFDIRD